MIPSRAREFHIQTNDWISLLLSPISKAFREHDRPENTYVHTHSIGNRLEQPLASELQPFKLQSSLQLFNCDPCKAFFWFPLRQIFLIASLRWVEPFWWWIGSRKYQLEANFRGLAWQKSFKRKRLSQYLWVHAQTSIRCHTPQRPHTRPSNTQGAWNTPYSNLPTLKYVKGIVSKSKKKISRL